jgi:hypothetical protein
MDYRFDVGRQEWVYDPGFRVKEGAGCAKTL